jgi:hypothetical protein
MNNERLNVKSRIKYYILYIKEKRYTNTKLYIFFKILILKLISLQIVLYIGTSRVNYIRGEGGAFSETNISLEC